MFGTALKELSLATEGLLQVEQAEMGNLLGAFCISGEAPELFTGPACSLSIALSQTSTSHNKEDSAVAKSTPHAS